jgi:hypothetical protein
MFSNLIFLAHGNKWSDFLGHSDDSLDGYVSHVDHTY